MPIQRPRANNNNAFQKINNNHNRADIIVKIRLKLDEFQKTDLSLDVKWKKLYCHSKLYS